MPGSDPGFGRAPLFVGTAGWSIAAVHARAFPPDGTHLSRYAARLDAVEINSSFYRPHRRETYRRWADSVPQDFRFAVKLPKAITHEKRLVACEPLLDRFWSEVEGLGPKLGALLVQLPPSLGFDASIAEPFFAAVHARCDAALACEPRRAEWFTPAAEDLLTSLRVARVAADPAPVPGAERPGSWPGLVYRRLHGSPRMYYSDYGRAALERIGAELGGHSVPTWCIFDNTAASHALGNALAMRRMTSSSESGAAGHHRVGA